MLIGLLWLQDRNLCQIGLSSPPKKSRREVLIGLHSWEVQQLRASDMTEVTCSVTVVRNLSFLYFSGLLSSSLYRGKDESSLITLYLCLVSWLNKCASPTSNSCSIHPGDELDNSHWLGCVNRFTNHYDQVGELASLVPHVHSWSPSFSGVGSIWLT